MRFNKEVTLTGEAPICPIELSDLVVGMNHLGWAPQSHDRFVLRKSSPLWWVLYLLGGRIIRLQFRHSQRVQQALKGQYWIEAKIDESGGQRTLALDGRTPFSERRKIEALLEALHQGRRWLTREGPLG